MRAPHDPPPDHRRRWTGPLAVTLGGVCVSVVLSLVLGRFVPVFVLFLPFVWTGRRRS